jgi:hypothetical protein
MIRTTDIALFSLMIVAAAGTYKVKAEANQKLAEIKRIEVQIAREEDTIDLLEADWSMLTQPDRLQRLVEAFATQLPLQPIEARQVVGVSDIPEKGIGLPDDDVIGETIAKIAKEKAAKEQDTQDDTETGSIDE